MHINKIIAGTSAVALSLSMTSVALAATASNTINLEVEVQDTLVFDCYDSAGGSGDTTVTLGTSASPGNVTAGTPAVGESVCNVTTNDDAGYYLTVVNDDTLSTGDVLSHIMPDNTNTSIADTTGGLTAWNWTGTVTSGHGSSQVSWASNITGLGFSVITIPANETTNNNLNGDWTASGSCPEATTGDTNDYAAFPDAAEAIAGVVTYQAGTTTTEMCYKVDVPSTQQSGDYSGSVTYTATTDASSLS
jgi:hypothetical protein